MSRERHPSHSCTATQIGRPVKSARLSQSRPERLATIGGAPDGRLSSVAGAGDGALPAGTMTAVQATDAISTQLEGVTRRLRERLTRLAEADAISQGILIDVADALEKQAWMLRAQRARD